MKKPNNRKKKKTNQKQEEQEINSSTSQSPLDVIDWYFGSVSVNWKNVS